MKKEEMDIVLSEEEKAAIAAQRKDMELLETFKKEYDELVSKTGFMWGVDLNSPLNNIQLGIGKVTK